MTILNTIHLSSFNSLKIIVMKILGKDHLERVANIATGDFVSSLFKDLL